jgi:hypothetical protein
MDTARPPSVSWSPEQIAEGKRRVQQWQAVAARMEQLRREELRRIDPTQAIALLCGAADYRRPPHAPRPTSGLVEQQRWFVKAAFRD